MWREGNQGKGHRELCFLAVRGMRIRGMRRAAKGTKTEWSVRRKGPDSMTELKLALDYSQMS